MSEPTSIRWPVAEIDPVRRLFAVAAGLPHVAIDEVVLDAPIDRVWALVGDIEEGAPQFELGVRSGRIVGRRDDLLDLEVRTSLGTRMHYQVELRFGWCLMRSRSTHIGLAAAPVDGGRRTRFAHFEGSPILGRVARPGFRWKIRGDFRRIARLTAPSSPVA